MEFSLKTACDFTKGEAVLPEAEEGTMRKTWFVGRRLIFSLAVTLAWIWAGAAAAEQTPLGGAKAPLHGIKVKRLLIKNAMVIYGNAKPAFGPVDILVQDGLIARVGATPPDESLPDAVIDATGKYITPGFINTHIHLHETRGNRPIPIQYELDLYLAAGCTTVREVGSGGRVTEPEISVERALEIREQSASGRLAAPRVLVYPMLDGSRGPEEQRAYIRALKKAGVDGIKLRNVGDRDVVAAIIDESQKLGLPTAAHIGFEETTARDYVELGVNSIEHFYGIPEASTDGIADIPPEMNNSNEAHRFALIGRLFLQSNFNLARLSELLDLMVQRGVAWTPTFSCYEASRDPIRARNLPWNKDYLHPALEEYFRPDLEHHGGYLAGWTTTQQVQWRQHFRLWMEAVHDFALKGGLVTVGDDAGFIVGALYGFCFARELEMLEEAGFRPLEVIKLATVNGAKLLRLDDRLGRVRKGFIADLLVVNGNPLENLGILNPYGYDILTYEGKPVSNLSPLVPGDPRIKVVHGGEIEWTIKNGIPYHVPDLLEEVKDMVAKARAARAQPEESPKRE
jgi:imidazolonepropionase-like amidohydrolase